MVQANLAILKLVMQKVPWDFDYDPGDGSIFVVDPATGERTWELLLSCPDGTDPRDPYRAVPVRLP